MQPDAWKMERTETARMHIDIPSFAVLAQGETARSRANNGILRII